MSHALFRDPYFPSITVCAISRGANDGRRDVVVSCPAQMGVKVCVDGVSSCSPFSANLEGLRSSTPKRVQTKTTTFPLPPLSWSLSRYRARCDRRGPAIEVAGSPPPSSSLPPNMPLVPPPAVVKHSHSILDVVVDEVSLFRCLQIGLMNWLHHQGHSTSTINAPSTGSGWGRGAMFIQLGIARKGTAGVGSLSLSIADGPVASGTSPNSSASGTSFAGTGSCRVCRLLGGYASTSMCDGWRLSYTSKGVVRRWHEGWRSRSASERLDGVVIAPGPARSDGIETLHLKDLESRREESPFRS